MKIDIQKNSSKEYVFSSLEKSIQNAGFTVAASDASRPWGGFFVIDEKDAEQFIRHFFKDVPQAAYTPGAKISPKLLVVASGKRLSWQYHFRRSEVWKVLHGNAGIVVSDTDEEGAPLTKPPGETVVLKQGERHRLIGGEDWTVLAEIWQHTDANQPSNEEDIVRISDDFGR